MNRFLSLEESIASTIIFLSGALFKRIPYFRHEWQAVEARCKIINYQQWCFIIGYTLLLVLQLSAVLDTIVHYLLLVSPKILKNFPINEPSIKKSHLFDGMSKSYEFLK